EGDIVAAVEVDFADEGAVGLQLRPSSTAGLVHFVVAIPVEFDGIVLAAAGEGAGHASKGKLAANGLEQDVGWAHQAEIVIGVVWHLDDAPSAQNAHAWGARSLGSRIKL